MAGAALDANGDGFEEKLVAGDDRMAHLNLIHGKEDRKLAGVFEFGGEEESAELCHGFDDEDTGHDGGAGVVALEEDIVEGDVFDADGFGVGVDFQDAVNHEHGVAVGEDALDFADVEGGFAVEEGGAVGVLFGVEEFFGEEVVEGVAGLVGDDAAADGSADEIEVADEVQYFVAGAFVGEAEVVFDGASGADN